MRLRSGGSASKMNLLTPTGMGPTRRESSSWSYSELGTRVNYWADGITGQAGALRGGRADVGDLPF